MPDPRQPISPHGWGSVFAAWVVATAATLGSLFFSEVMALPPCALCWYQRVFMFPLPVLLLRGLFPYDPRVTRYALPLAGLGGGVALWHTLLYEGVLPESAAPCMLGVPCARPGFELLGVLPIPALSLLAFVVVAALLLHARQRLP